MDVEILSLLETPMIGSWRRQEDSCHGYMGEVVEGKDESV